MRRFYHPKCPPRQKPGNSGFCKNGLAGHPEAYFRGPPVLKSPQRHRLANLRQLQTVNSQASPKVPRSQVITSGTRAYSGMEVILPDVYAFGRHKPRRTVSRKHIHPANAHQRRHSGTDQRAPLRTITAGDVPAGQQCGTGQDMTGQDRKRHDKKRPSGKSGRSPVMMPQTAADYFSKYLL